MTVPTPPAVSEAMREAVAQWLRDRFPLNGWQSTAQAIALLKSGPIASEIARLTGERDRLRRDHLPHMCRDDHAEIRHGLSDDDERCPVCRERDRAEAAEAALSRLQADRDAEVGKLRAALAEIVRLHNAPSPDAEAIVRIVRVARAALTESTDA